MIVLGRSVCGSTPLVKLSDGLVFYLVQELCTLGIVRHLSSLGHWDLLPGDAAPIVEARVEELCELNDHRLWSRFEHYRLNDINQRRNVTRVIFVNNKTTLHVADDLNAAVQ